MKTLDFLQNNVGGVWGMRCIPRKEMVQVLLNEKMNTCAVKYKNSDNVVDIRVIDYNAYNFVEEYEDNDANGVWHITIEGVLPALDRNSEAIIKRLQREEVFVLVMDQNGTIRLCGTELALLRFFTKKQTGESPIALNGITFSLSCYQERETYIITSEEVV